MPPDPAPISVSVSPATTAVQVGQTQGFTATVNNDSQNKGVTWKLAGAGCSGAICGTVMPMSSASGAAVTYMAPASVPNPATVTLTATSVADGTKAAAATVTISAVPTVTVTLSLAAATVQVGTTQTFTAIVQNDPANKGVTWTLSGLGCTSNTNLCGTLSPTSSASGAAVTYTAPATAPKPMTVNLTATSVTDDSKFAVATITVAAVGAISVGLSPAVASVQAGGTQTFTATVPNDSANKGVNWTISGAGCSGATCGVVSPTSSASGAAVTYTAPATVPSPAIVTLTATSLADGTKSATATITITAITVTLSPTTASVGVGGTQTFTATVQNDSANKGVNWTISGAGCNGATCGAVSPTLSASGAAVTYTAPATVPSPATVTLTATSAADGTRSAAATITVVTGVTLTPVRGGLAISQQLNFTATVTNDVGGQGVTWSASAGIFSAQTATTATYVAPGTAGVVSVTATSKADVTKSASATIGVTDLSGVLSYHNDLSRDGVNAQEYALTTSNVSSGTFGKLFSCTVDGAVYAQPLWVPGVTVNGASHNLILVATQGDSLYAFDADANLCVKLWQVSLIDGAHGGGGSGAETTVPSGPTGNLVGQGAGDITPEVGVTGTPVIDLASKTLYVVSKSVVGSGPTFFQRLHAIDITTGGEKFGGPNAISASVAGNAPDATGGQVVFNPQTQNQRPGLALVNGVIYVAWASHEDADQYHGWLIGYDAGTLNRISVFNTTPNTIATFPYSRGGIWMSGGAPAADSSNNLYMITGNGTYDGVTNFGDSLLKFSTSSGLSLADWFTPSDQDTLNLNDLDFGSGGAVLLINAPSAPTPHLLIGGGKAGSGNLGELFLLNRDALGNFNGTDSQVVQKFPTNNEIFSTPAFWNNTLYVAPVGSKLLSFSFDPNGGQFTNTSSPGGSSTTFGFPGATPSVSSTGASNGIVWALDNSQYCTPQSTGCGPAVLHGYDATALGTELWNSTQGTGNSAGNAVKFSVPTVANGKVYIGTRGSSGTNGGIGEIDVYGLLPN